MVWSKYKEYSHDDIDPNYCTREMYGKSHFYKALRKWLAAVDPDEIPFHIDIHGRFNQKKMRGINVGIRPLFRDWPYEDPKNEFAKELKTKAEKLIDKVFDGVKVDGFKVI